jgi:hypothetical protein
VNRRRTRRILIGVPVVLVVLVMGLVLVIVVVTRIGDQPAPVPAAYRPPASLPTAAVPLAADHLAFDSDRSGNYELFVMSRDGSDARPLTTDRAFDSWWPRISPDRRTIIFYRSPAGRHDLDFSVSALWAVAADGSGLTLVRPAGLDRWTVQGHAEWSPDGTRLVMFGGSRINPQIYLTDGVGQQPQAVTGRGGTNIDPSFAPDGRSIVFIGCPQAMCTEPDYEVYQVPVSGGDPVRLTDDDIRDNDPAFSPDGRHLAWLSQIGTGGIGGVGVWDVRIAGPDGRNPRRLVGDDGVTSKPEWARDSQTIFVHRIPPGQARFGIYELGLNGAVVHDLTAGQPGANEYGGS